MSPGSAEEISGHWDGLSHGTSQHSEPAIVRVTAAHQVTLLFALVARGEITPESLSELTGKIQRGCTPRF